MEAFRAPLGKAVRFLRRLPRAYSVGVPLVALGSVLLVASLLSHFGIEGVIVVTGEAPYGTAERTVSLTLTTYFRATLAVESCRVAFYLLTDSDYELYLTNGRLPPPSLDCNQTEAVVEARIGHMVTVSSELPNSTTVPYVITATFYAEQLPYAALSIPGAILAIGATVWIAVTMLTRGAERLVMEFRERKQERKGK